MAKLSVQMLSMLEDVVSGFGTHGAAMGDGQHAGRYATARALRRRALLDGDELTDDGRKVLAENGIHTCRWCEHVWRHPIGGICPKCCRFQVMPTETKV